uniref:Major facilitator superfamily (MFS) profile domain-containing protein n=1 Tax=Acrobeloides nanus TaxID=290746 RepID=A0A914EEE8_9BILA
MITIVELIYLEETPKFLLINKQDPEAAHKAMEFYQGQYEIGSKLDEILKEHEEEAKISFCRGFIQMIKVPHQRKAFIIGILALQIIAGIWSITFLSSDLFMAYFDSELAQYASFIFMVADFIACIIGNVISEKFTRRVLLLSSAIGNTICLLGYVVFDRLAFYVYDSLKYLSVISIVLYGITYGIGVGPISYFITSEITSQQHRALIQSMVFAVNTLSGFVLGLVTLPAYNWIGVWSFLPLYIIPSILCIIYLYYNLPETKGREIADILRDMKRK